MKSESIYHAANDREAGEIETVLTRANVDYTMHLEVSKHADGVCYQGLMFDVEPEDVERARAALRTNGYAPIVSERRKTAPTR